MLGRKIQTLLEVSREAKCPLLVGTVILVFLSIFTKSQAVCSSELTDLGPDSPPVSQLFSILDESLSLKASLCPTCTLGLMTAWTSRDVLRHRWDKTWNIWESCLRQSVPPTPVYYSYYLLCICPSSDPNPQSLLNVSVSVHG